MRLLILITVCISMASCATKTLRSPDFYPNAHLEQVGKSQAHSDTRYCMSLADDYVKDPEKWKGVVGETAESATLGAATGAVSGAIFSAAGRGTAAGAAAGAIIGLYRGLVASGEPNPSYERFVEQCLADKGYRIYGWS